MAKLRKNILLSPAADDYIESYRKDHGNLPYNQAIEKIIEEHKSVNPQFNSARDKALVNLLLESFEQKYGSILTRIRLGSTVADRNSQIILEVLNSICQTEAYGDSFFSIDGAQSHIVGKAKEHIKDKITLLKQKKDFKENKN